MSPLRGTPPCGNPKQGSRAKKLDSRFRGNDKYCFRKKNYLNKEEKDMNWRLAQ